MVTEAKVEELGNTLAEEHAMVVVHTLTHLESEPLVNTLVGRLALRELDTIPDTGRGESRGTDQHNG